MMLSGTSTPPALPTAAAAQRYLSCFVTRDSIAPPTVSIAPAQVSDSRPRARLGEIGARDDPRGAEPAQVGLGVRAAGYRGHLVAEPREQRHRDRADAAGGAGDQHRPGRGARPWPSSAMIASIAVRPAVPIAMPGAASAPRAAAPASRR